MLERLVEKIVNELISNGFLTANKQEEYIYSFTCFIETAISSVVFLLMGLFLHQFIPTLLFMLFFSNIKKRCGGLHANTYVGCLSSSCAIYLFFMTFISPFLLENKKYCLFLLLVGGAVLWVIGSVDHPGMGWSRREQEENKKLARRNVLLEVIIIFVIWTVTEQSALVVFTTFAVFLNAVLLLIAKIKEEKYEERCTEEEGSIDCG